MHWLTLFCQGLSLSMFYLSLHIHLSQKTDSKCNLPSIKHFSIISINLVHQKFILMSNKERIDLQKILKNIEKIRNNKKMEKNSVWLFLQFYFSLKKTKFRNLCHGQMIWRKSPIKRFSKTKRKLLRGEVEIRKLLKWIMSQVSPETLVRVFMFWMVSRSPRSRLLETWYLITSNSS